MLPPANIPTVRGKPRTLAHTPGAIENTCLEESARPRPDISVRFKGLAHIKVESSIRKGNHNKRHRIVIVKFTCSKLVGEKRGRGSELTAPPGGLFALKRGNWIIKFIPLMEQIHKFHPPHFTQWPAFSAWWMDVCGILALNERVATRREGRRGGRRWNRVPFYSNFWGVFFETMTTTGGGST